jgi:carbamoyltransferase
MTMYSILAINPGHNGSAALVVDGVLAFYGEEERVSRMKYDGNPFRAMLQVLINHPVDELIIGGTSPELAVLPWTGENAYSALARKFNPNIKVSVMGNLHHLGHAAAAFYGSGFETAAAIIVDGSGSVHRERVSENGPEVAGYETETIYQCSYPHEFNAVYKRYSDGGTNTYYDNGIQEFDSSVTITKAYEAVSQYLGFGFIEAGKTMGLSPYGKPDTSIPPFFVNGKGNKNLLIPAYPAGAHIDENRFPYLKRYTEPREWHNDFNLVREQDKNLAYAVQNEAEEMVMRLIQKAIDTTGETNIVLSGGFALNCVANYKYVKAFPNIEFYVDPMAHDGGTAIGLAQYAWYQHSKELTVRPLTSVYLGAPPNYEAIQVAEKNGNIKVEDATAEDVADLLSKQQIVALFQGQAEGGPRALGNRSILFDPRAPNGKEFINSVKHREWFRPFAGSVMAEYADQLFEMAGLEESPFMMYAVKVREDKADLIPAVTHVDGTCRIQTVTEKQNPVYYKLIKAFESITGMPMLFNTSFNLAGQPLVESTYDALVTLFNSEIQYLYMPDLGKLITKVKSNG